MVKVARLIGGAGTGKTRELMGVVEQVVARILDPALIGFVSFTRAACEEAADRASDLLNLPKADLRQRGWFRTLHGVVYKCLGVGDELLTDTRESRRWVENALDERLASGPSDGFSAIEDGCGITSEASLSLQLWSAARNRLEPLKALWKVADHCSPCTVPPYEHIRATVTRYEQAKRLDGRVDFTDILGRFAGYQFHPDGHQQCEPNGTVPNLEVWIHDEMQDSSRLLDACFRRLIAAESVRWVYLAGDPYQSIYGWAGSDPGIFMQGYEAAKSRVMPQSYRCPEAILDLGEDILRDCSDYVNRGIKPVGPGGDIDLTSAGIYGPWSLDIDPNQSWLLLARTNYEASRLASMLSKRSIPWLPIRKDAGCGWKAPSRNAAIKAFWNLEAGAPIDGSEWQEVCKHIPASPAGGPLLERGTKARFAALDNAQSLYPLVFLGQLPSLGATDRLVDLIRTGKWVSAKLIEGADDYQAAVKEWGQDAVDNPGVRLGTIHSAKGMEADNVALLTTMSEPCARACETQEGHDEEQRVWYVGATRAKKRLVVIKELARFIKKLPL